LSLKITIVIKCQIYEAFNLNLDMAKPIGQKNTKNKAKHSRLMAQKINKKKAEKKVA